MSIHSTARLGKDCEVGVFAMIGAHCKLGDNCKIANHATLYPGSVLGDRVEFDEYSNSSGAVILGDDCKIKKTAIVGQGAIMEEKCWLGPFAILIHERHASWHRTSPISEGCYIHAGAVIGAHACIVAGVTVGYNAEIGAGAVVTKDCEDNGIYIGVPAQRVGTVPPERRVEFEPHAPYQFTRDILGLYLPHLVSVGKYAVR